MPRLLILAMLFMSMACGPAEGDRGHHRLAVAPPTCTDLALASPNLAPPDTLATHLEVPWDLAFLPDGRILVTERAGRIRVVHPEEGLQEEPWATVEVTPAAEAGLLGIDLAPDFAETGHVYLMGTYENVPDETLRRWRAGLVRRIAPDRAPAWVNRVVRLSDRDGRGTDPVTILDGIPAGQIHAGGGVRFGPDGLLHLAVGDGGIPEAAARRRSLRGKLLRYDPEGQPQGVDGTPLLALGLRNPQALDWHPVSGELFAIDHGPTGLEREGRRRDKDELNRIEEGGDYGWPAVAGMWEGEGIIAPVVEWTPALAPAGMTFVDDPGGAWHGNALVTGLRGRQLRRLVLATDGSDETAPVVCEESLFHAEFGRLRAVRVGPDRHLYFTTSNRDQRGVPGPDDDLLLRIRLPDAGPPDAPPPDG